MTAKKATHQQTKKHNRDLVLKTIFDHESISRAEIARITKLTRTTVSDVVGGLISEGLVKEIGFGSSIGGKTPILLSLIPDSRYLIGLNLAQDRFIGSIVNLRGDIKKTVDIPVKDNDGEQALDCVYSILDELFLNDYKPVIGIGVGTPGLINTRDGIVIDAVNLKWRDLPLAHLLESRYHSPVSVLNDSHATAVGEFVYGDGFRSDENLIVVTVKHGIGAGILINGRLFQGDGGGAGEIGHVVVKENGELCRCGKRGCLETIASARAVVQRAQTVGQDGKDSGAGKAHNKITLDSIQAAYQAGDPITTQIVLEAGHYLGISLAGLVGALNIQNIVLTGDMTRFGKAWLDCVREAMLQAALTKMTEDTRISIGKLDYRGCILGASAMLFQDGYSLLFRSDED